MVETHKQGPWAQTLESSTSLPEDFTFSQRSIQDFVECERRFELRYLKKLRWPAAASEPMEKFERLTALGTTFHRMVHRERSGVAPELLLKINQDPTLQTWFKHYLDHFPRPIPEDTFSEITLGAVWDETWRVTATFDLLMHSEESGFRIVDWKTTRKKPRRERLRARIQTSLYPLLFSEAGRELFTGKEFGREGIEMVYWYPEFPSQPDIFKFTMEDAERLKDRLKALLKEITSRPAASGKFPKTDLTDHCRFCVYRSLCGRGTAAGAVEEPVVDEIAAVKTDLDDIGFENIEVIRY